MIRRAAGIAAVALLKAIARLPLPVAQACGLPLTPLYLAARPRLWPRLAGAAPSPVTALAFGLAYYPMRLRLALLSLRHLLGRPDGCARVIENADLYHDALRTGKPVVLLGWHQGPVELLHLVPHADKAAAGRLKVLMTAGAFAPAVAEFMRRGRAVDGKVIARPGERDALRRWARERGVLAVMVDQVPGRSDDRLPLGKSGWHAPYPERLMRWIEARDPVCLGVSVQWERGRVIRFRYLPMAGDGLKSGVIACAARAMTSFQARLQYNWSYPKITRA